MYISNIKLINTNKRIKIIMESKMNIKEEDKKNKNCIWVSEDIHREFKSWCAANGKKIGETADMIIKLGISTYETDLRKND
tara:strand:- start:222 stop:464 length:243 start_codon:yes stop_codon:yes gene_type:complete